ncbi:MULTISPECIES: peptidylprolyl isomerase [unclassified Shewanella]|uniref:FKBP-type peptidyl-prolyl cis-trans isomerase n=1 Tax=unclassified Shewanella TaxID=196818 RepID=UPI000C8319DD|nr:MULTISPECIES: peptidylprolyl isomerase [unclassified Shewanella]MDO6640394.1 peptidylprolyl isomerase [Shewanella sp. 5_MG-2023]MDO6677856.1 peptidylprolyl isomerase [Shewanella sp. 4_MG-2023]PMG51247.1 peptidylprolyl isomerase [Shewanella sp. 10N.286.52.B9]PMH87017.1 peptidylprolyl isomerase [Shewanella sp. 10N.286.48.B5]PMI02027.1 peptidylprolyl isomerase [Shewanella sp. 10N.286.48.A6]
MSAQDNMVVRFNYTLRDEQGEVIESNEGGSPIAYLHGHDNMMPGVENAIAGKDAGEKFTVTLPAAETYGERMEGAEQRVSVKHLQGAKVWKVGMSAIVNTEEGQRQVTIVKMGKFMATIDTNHPLAGRELTFDIEVVDFREATDEEIAHGHSHGEGGHQH